jgi:DNA-binding transcriptional LysR family regulator
VLPSLAAEWLPAAIAVYRRRFPGVALQLFDTIAGRSLALVREGAVDFALTAAGDLREFETRLLFNEPFYLVCRKDHRLARRRSIRLRDLEGVDFIHSVRTGSIRQSVQPALRDVKVNDTGLEIEQLGPLAGLVGIGIGVTLVPELALFQFRRAPLVAVRVADRTLNRPIYLVKRRGRSLSAAASALLEVIERTPRRRVSAAG